MHCIIVLFLRQCQQVVHFMFTVAVASLLSQYVFGASSTKSVKVLCGLNKISIISTIITMKMMKC